jgi:hypothetical protein
MTGVLTDNPDLIGGYITHYQCPVCRNAYGEPHESTHLFCFPPAAAAVIVRESEKLCRALARRARKPQETAR